MYYLLTNNIIQYKGHTLHQIQKIGSSLLGGYIESEENLQQGSDSWIGKNSYVYGDSCISEKVRVGQNCVIVDSILNGKLYIRDGVTITNCTLYGMNPGALISFDTKISDIELEMVGLYTSTLFNDGRLVKEMYKGITILKSDNFCRCGCVEATTEASWKYITNDNLWLQLKTEHQSTPKIFRPDVREYLQNSCQEALDYKYKKTGRN